MNKKRFSALRLILIVFVIVLLAGIGVTGERTLREPVEVRTLRKQQVTQSDEGHQEYYFGLLNEDEQRGYREILEGIRSFEEKFYLSLSGDDEIDRVYQQCLRIIRRCSGYIIVRRYINNLYRQGLLPVFSGIYLYRG